ncbi:HNH endonuclease family protein [Streptomyces sp. H27-C3]|uniref:HNH endonuclease family protein n=1 Tax=Streptomyces sp. H27-C3 TaxID=3046305 RepID=UPI0024BA609B|nr:HNH endonuclease family protein [Streptomyces sp. H27-C3]MDJ0460457.1 HNH endonuclease family protein [Streptomyces sp. H27-C3]
MLRKAAPVALLTAALALTGCTEGGVGDLGDGSSGSSGQGGGPAGEPGSALAAVQKLTVKGRAPKTGYEREEFGRAWADADDNGCGTRDDILKRDLTGERFKAGVRGGDCEVVSGTLTDDPYTGRRVEYVRGRSKVDIDHLVALSDAWQKGAQQWGRSKRVALANDPLNLLAVDSSANRRKSDGDTATWLPGNKEYRCTYVARQVAVKKKYELWVTGAERDAMKRVLSGCPDERLPAGGGPTEAPAGL